jgi:hypothetical protein
LWLITNKTDDIDLHPERQRVSVLHASIAEKLAEPLIVPRFHSRIQSYQRASYGETRAEHQRDGDSACGYSSETVVGHRAPRDFENQASLRQAALAVNPQSSSNPRYARNPQGREARQLSSTRFGGLPAKLDQDAPSTDELSRRKAVMAPQLLDTKHPLRLEA